jgi:hypothetical protein
MRRSGTPASRCSATWGDLSALELRVAREERQPRFGADTEPEALSSIREQQPGTLCVGGEHLRRQPRPPARQRRRKARLERSASSPLRIRTLRGSVVRMGSLRGEPLYGVRLLARVCSQSSGAADRTYPTAFRIAHYVAPRRAAAKWGQPFRILVNDLYWLVPLGETRGVCGDVEFEDVIPPDNYGGLESALGVLGHTRACYGVQLTLRAILDSPGRATSKRISAGKRAIIQCRSFGPS